jgi:hypothetical protein
MRFRIFGDKSKLMPVLDEFIGMCKEQYADEMAKTKHRLSYLPIPVSTAMLDMPFEIGYIEEEDCLMFWNTWSIPKIIRKPVVRKMEKNLMGFLNTRGCVCRVEYVGD